MTLGIYYITPWLSGIATPSFPIRRCCRPGDRRFFFFWIEIWPHEFYFVAGLLIMAGLGLFLFTLGAGPDVVRLFVPADGLDRPVLTVRALESRRPQRKVAAVERRVELSQMAAEDHEMGGLAVIAVATGGAWVFYFADAPRFW